MDATANYQHKPRTLASQPAAAAYVGAPATGTITAPGQHGADPIARDVRTTRTRLERMLLAAQQMQQQ